jgi:signal transduction histidine kinase/DNA-binding response OmpR family regulator
MPKKKLHQRLNHLFAELEQETVDLPQEPQPRAETPPAVAKRASAEPASTTSAVSQGEIGELVSAESVAATEARLPGWTWECDGDGNYRQCSPEAGDFLGIEAKEFGGKRMTQFCLTAASAKALELALGHAQFPLEIGVDFVRADGTPLPATLHIFQPSSGNGQGGWRGFSIVTRGAEAPAISGQRAAKDELPDGQEPESEEPEETPQSKAEKRAPAEAEVVEPVSKPEEVEAAAPAEKEIETPENTLETAAEVALSTEVAEVNPEAPVEGQAEFESPEEGPAPELRLERKTPPSVLKSRQEAGAPTPDTQPGPSGASRWYGEQAISRKGYKNGDEAALRVALPLTEDDSSLLFEFLDESPERRWSKDERLLVEQVVDQVSLALENARLFEQTQNARDALAVRERYQKGVALAATTLTEKGSRALPEVLKILGQAAGASQALYFQAVRQEGRYFWRLQAHWATGKERTAKNERMAPRPGLQKPFPMADLAAIARHLAQAGYMAESPEGFPAEARAFLQAMHAHSPLLLAVPGKDGPPGCLVFDTAEYERLDYKRLDYKRQWGLDEIAALQTAAAALANTLAREDLLSQVRTNLEQTEQLYQASAELNRATSYDQVVAVLRQHTLLGQTATSAISLALFSRAYTQAARPEWMVEAARWQAGGFTAVDLDRRKAIQAWDFIAGILGAGIPTRIDHPSGDPRIRGAKNGFFLDPDQADQLMFIPLNVAGKWIGYLAASGDSQDEVSETEMRRLTALAGQAAVAVENLRLLKETRRRNEELATINRIIEAANQSMDMTEMLVEVLRQVLKTTDYEAGLISILNPFTERLNLVASQALPDALVNKLYEKGLEGTLCHLVYQGGKPLSVEDLSVEAPVDASGLVNLGFYSYLGVPLESKGKSLGTLCVFGKRPIPASEGGTALMQSIGQQVGVAIENVGLFEQTQQALAETGAMYEASAELNAAQSYDDILRALQKYTFLGQAEKLLSLNVFEHPWDGEQAPEWSNSLVCSSSLPKKRVKRRYALPTFPALRNLLNPKSAAIIEDVLRDERLDEATLYHYAEQMEAKSAAILPLVVGTNWFGFIEGIFGSKRKFGAQEVRKTTALANQAAVALQNIRLLEESRRRADQLQTAAEIARDTSSTLALEKLLERTANLICERFGYYQASIFLLDEEGEYALVRESTGAAGTEMKQRGHKLAVGSRSVIGYVTQSGSPLVIDDVQHDPLHRPNPLLPETQAEVGIPMKIGGRILGALDVQSSQSGAFSEDDIAALQILADQIAVAVDNARAYELSQQAVEEMREIDRLKSQFLANMSHELRTPLNSIIGFSRVILKGIDGPVNELQQQDLSAIYNSGQHLLGLINDVLDLSKIEAGKMELAFEPDVNLADLTNSVMSTVVGLVKDKPVELRREVADDLPLVRADPLKIRQVLINLLSNAAKFTDEGSIRVQAGVERRADGGEEVVVSVIDTGSGIAQADQEKLFRPFSQVDGSLTRKTGGSGLGLSICKHLIEMHGGRIGVESTPGEGARFFFTLPVPVAEGTSYPDGSRKVVLAVDDERQVIELYERYLSAHGYQVIALTDPNQAVARAKEIQPFAITLDVMMPGRDGWQVLQALKRDAATKDIPVVVCSILQDQRKGFSLGAADYLMKPILEEDLLQAIEKLDKNGDIREILAVDDDLETLRLIEKIFRKYGKDKYRLVLAEGGHQALTAIDFKKPDAILLDLFMPGLDGFTLLETLKADPGLQDIPVIIVTAGDLDEQQRLHLAQFSEAMLNKTLFQEEVFLNVLEQALERFG